MVTAVANVTMRESKARSTMQKKSRTFSAAFHRQSFDQ